MKTRATKEWVKEAPILTVNARTQVQNRTAIPFCDHTHTHARTRVENENEENFEKAVFFLIQ